MQMYRLTELISENWQLPVRPSVGGVNDGSHTWLPNDIEPPTQLVGAMHEVS